MGRSIPGVPVLWSLGQEHDEPGMWNVCERTPIAAEAALLQARKGFMERGLAYEVAVVSLDLGQVYLKLQLPDEVRQIVGETVPIFRSLRIGRDALIALLQLRKAVDRSE